MILMPRPLHELHRTFLLSCSLVVLPLYMSSRETLRQITNQVKIPQKRQLHIL
uniref:Uncharacterized protein n=1 Tax=Gadus morhua TaxID=8049 RepID=A0A8C5C4U2_GADMO